MRIALEEIGEIGFLSVPRGNNKPQISHGKIRKSRPPGGALT
jgi:hypothetical protein